MYHDGSCVDRNGRGRSRMPETTAPRRRSMIRSTVGHGPHGGRLLRDTLSRYWRGMHVHAMDNGAQPWQRGDVGGDNATLLPLGGLDDLGLGHGGRHGPRAGRSAPPARDGSGSSSRRQSSVGTHYYGGCVDSVANDLDTMNNCSVAATVTFAGAPRHGNGGFSRRGRCSPDAPVDARMALGSGHVFTNRRDALAGT